MFKVFSQFSINILRLMIEAFLYVLDWIKFQMMIWPNNMMFWRMRKLFR